MLIRSILTNSRKGEGYGWQTSPIIVIAWSPSTNKEMNIQDDASILCGIAQPFTRSVGSIGETYRAYEEYSDNG